MISITSRQRQMLLDLKTARGWSYREMAKEIGLPKTTIQDFISGKSKTVTDETFKIVKKAFGERKSHKGISIKKMGERPDTGEVIVWLPREASAAEDNPAPNLSNFPDTLYQSKMAFTELQFDRAFIESPEIFDDYGSREIIYKFRYSAPESQKTIDKETKKLEKAMIDYGVGGASRFKIRKDFQHVLAGSGYYRNQRKVEQLRGAQSTYHQRLRVWDNLSQDIKRKTTKEKFLKSGDLGYRKRKEDLDDEFRPYNPLPMF